MFATPRCDADYGQRSAEFRNAGMKQSIVFAAAVCLAALAALPTQAQEAEQRARDARLGAEAKTLIATHCFDCHNEVSKEAGLDLVGLLKKDDFDGTLMFERLITAKMPPKDEEQPTAVERRLLLNWLAQRQDKSSHPPYRRRSRHEFVQAVNDLLGTRMDLARQIPEDRGTYLFDSDRRIQLTKEQLTAYFTVADEMLDFALPENGFPQERIWTTSKIKDSHHTYNIYTRKYQQGLLFSWTRANNGNSYSFFYDNFDPPVKEWYELTFDAAKLGDFKEDISIQVYAGKYYFADDRPQPQRLLDVISLGNKELKSHTLRVFLYPGENVSVHCYCKHTWRQQKGQQGAYIKQLQVRGPVLEQWPPRSYRNVFAGLPLDAPPRKAREVSAAKTALEQIGGSLSVSSFQQGREKEKMQDGSNLTFWHTRFTPTLAKPPHYVILKNPAGKEIAGLSYSTWSGGDGNGQVKGYSVSVSDDGKTWEKPIVAGKLEVLLAAEETILFPAKTKKRFIKFLVTDAVSHDGKSLASIGKLDVLVDLPTTSSSTKITVSSKSQEDLKKVIRRFAEQAFASSLNEEELAPYYQVSLKHLKMHGDFVAATKVGLKAILSSHRFLLVPGEHRNRSFKIAADLARCVWLSVPDRQLLDLAAREELQHAKLKAELARMLADPKSNRMVRSLCAQWLNLRLLKKVSPSLKLYPTYDDLLNQYLPLETEAYLAHLIEHNLPVSYLIDSDFSILNQRLAQHYDVDGVIGQQMRKVSFHPDSPRGGLMTMGSVLKATADGFDTSPILRGAWISRTIVGNSLSPPPANVEAIEPERSKARTLKEQIAAHKKNESCYACHKSIDPYGFALENFDATGQWRTTYRVKTDHEATFAYRPQGYYQQGSVVDASGEIGDVQFTDVTGLKKLLLADHQMVAYNFSKTLFEYANGYAPNLEQRLALHKMIPAKAEECRMRDLIIDVLSYSFEGGQP